jgi:heptosyltransferase-1
MRILLVRLSALGDIVHTLPCAASLRASFPEAEICWLMEHRWAYLAESNPHVSAVLSWQRSLTGTRHVLQRLRRERFDLVIDVQGLLKSAAFTWLSRASERIGYSAESCREPLAALAYTRRVCPSSAHVVDRQLELVREAGAQTAVREFPLPAGHPEGELPETPFVLAAPLAGWPHKQWPEECYSRLALRLQTQLGMPLVVTAAAALRIPNCISLSCGLPGLIYALRRCAAYVGGDTGPTHLAAALGKPGVALYGPTDPARNGPYGSALRVLRAVGAETSYARRSEPAESMRRISIDAVFAALSEVLCR